jgi:tRNA (guanine37-N1)-methyltransferase
MKVDILTIFPSFYQQFLETSIVHRAIREDKVSIHIHDLRDFAHNKHRQIDDTPYGGGVGMLMQFPPIYDAVHQLKKENTKVYLTSPQGKKLNQDMAISIAKEAHIILISGHYEGVDARVETLIDGEISIGDVVLTNGDIPAMLITDAIVRLLPDVIMEASVKEDSLYDGLLKHPQYTKPESYKGFDVPKVLLSGHHANIEKWRNEQKMSVTKKKRPDLLTK